MGMFTFNAGIPAGQDNPSDDQPPMQNNNISSLGIIAVDHVGYNTSGGGQHTKITFNQDASYVPIPTVNPPQLFTNIQDGFTNPLPGGLAQLFYYSGDTAHSSNQYLSALTGSTYLFGGIILKWGLVNGALDNNIIGFPNPFPNNCFAIQLTNFQGSSNPNLAAILSVTPNTPAGLAPGFVPRIRLSSGTTISCNLCYVAIGN